MKKLATAAYLALCFAAVVAWKPSSATEGDISSVFLLQRSSNKNEVHYKALVYTDHCSFRDDYPIRGYWRNFEEGRWGPASRLLHRERPYYGVTLLSKKSVVDTDRALIQINAFPERRITVRVREVEGKCIALAFVTIKKRLAVLEKVYVKVGVLSVDYLKLIGHDPKTRERLTERVDI
jgi:hypothetical protein